MTRYQTLILWNGIWVDTGGHSYKSKREIIEIARKIKAKWSQNALLFYLEWDDEHPEEQILVRRFTSKELLGEEE